MKTIIPSKTDLLFALADQAVVGLSELGATLGVTQNTQVKTAGDLTAARTANGALQNAITTRLGCSAAQSNADAAAGAFIRLARDVFKAKLGTKYSLKWKEVGFKNNTLAVPSTIAERVELVQSIADYLAAHADMEVAAIHLTHDDAQDIHDTLLGAMNDLDSAWGVQREKSTVNTAALAILRKRLRGLIHELSQLMAPTDPRWRDFGFNIPADQTTPPAPTDLTVSDGLPGHLRAAWAPVEGAFYYRLFKQVVGVDTRFVHVRNTYDTSADFNTFTTGQEVQIELTAVNSAGESLPCTPVEHVVP